VLLQSCRGTFGSAGSSSRCATRLRRQDTVGWLREQSWFDGRLATYVQATSVRPVGAGHGPAAGAGGGRGARGPHDFSRTAYHNGVFGLYNSLGWGDLIAHQENTGVLQGLLRLVSAERRLQPALDRMPVAAGARDLLGDDAIWFERWLEHPRLSDRSGSAAVRGRPAADHGPDLARRRLAGSVHRAVPGAVPGAGRQGVPTRLLVGPWTHLQARARGHHAARAWPGSTVTQARTFRAAGVTGDRRCREFVRIWVGGEARSSGGTCPAGRGGAAAAVVLGAPGALSLAEPAADAGARPARFHYDRPTRRRRLAGHCWPSRRARATTGRSSSGLTSWFSAAIPRPAGRDHRRCRRELSVTRDNPYADLFVRCATWIRAGARATSATASSG